MWQRPGSGGGRCRNVARPPTIRSRAADIATTRSASAIGGSPCVQRSLSPRSATARLRTTIEPVTPAHLTGIASGRSIGSDRQPDRRERPAEAVTGSDRTAGEQHRADRCEHEACATDAESARAPADRAVRRRAACSAPARRSARARRAPSMCTNASARSAIGVLRANAGRHAPRTDFRRSGPDVDPEQVGDSDRVPVGLGPATAARSVRRASCRRGRQGAAGGRHGDDRAGDDTDHFGGEQDDPQGVRTGIGQPSGEPRCPRDGAESNADSAELAPGVGHARSRPSAPAGPAVDRTSCHRHVHRPP